MSLVGPLHILVVCVNQILSVIQGIVTNLVMMPRIIVVLGSLYSQELTSLNLVQRIALTAENAYLRIVTQVTCGARSWALAWLVMQPALRSVLVRVISRVGCVNTRWKNLRYGSRAEVALFRAYMA